MQKLRNHFITSKRVYREGDVVVFRHIFDGQGIASAQLYITALGVYEAELNGEKISDQMFAPGYTYYPRRLLFQAYDLIGHLQNGPNTLKVFLGQGWYCGRFTHANRVQIYGEKQAVAWILELTAVDGTKKIYTSDEKVDELESPYLYAGEYDGEEYQAGLSDRVIGNAVAFAGPLPESFEPTLVQVKLQESMPVRSVSRVGDKTILDFGQNFAGVATINPVFLKGHGTVTLRHGEILNPDGSLYTTNLRKAKATLIYHPGEEEKVYIPRFTYMGFRYIELSGTTYVDGLISSYALYTDMPRTGYFECGHPLVQKIYDNQVWGQKSNYVEVPTDCPQRDERQGYTGDGHVFALTGSYNYDTEKFWENFLSDLTLGQLDNTEGYVGATVPAEGPAGIGRFSMLGWGNAVTLLPEMLHWQFGSEEAMLRQYDSIKRFVDAEIRQMGDKNLWIGISLGDWLAPFQGMGYHAMHNNPISNAFIVHDLEVVAAVANQLGKTDDAEKYGDQAERTRQAYISLFIDGDTGMTEDDYQSAYVMALKYVLPEGELREKVARQFVANVRKNGLQTGFFATAHLLPLLADLGQTKLAYDILLSENYPGWLYQINRGATTAWERWDAILPDGTINESSENLAGSANMVSFNHYAFGSVGEFFYRCTLGIKPLEPGYKKVLIEPRPDRRLGWAKGSYLSRAGKIDVTWRYEGDSLHIEVSTPVEGRIKLPGGDEKIVEAGRYSYEVQNAI